MTLKTNPVEAAHSNERIFDYKNLILLTSLFFVAIASRTSNLNLPPIYDELYHILSARGISEFGFPKILSGSYQRSIEYTYFVHYIFELSGGHELYYGRLISSSIPGSLSVVVLGGWVLKRFGIIEFFIASFFMVFWKLGVDVSQFLRFYSIHGLFFLIAAISFYELIETNRSLWYRMLLLIISMSFFALSAKLQIITLIGASGAALWGYVIIFCKLPKNSLLKITIIITTTILIFLLYIAFLDKIYYLYNIFTSAPPTWTADKFFYHRELRESYPALWPLFPALAAIALYKNKRAISFCISIFVLSLLIQSAGERKDLRFIYQVMPFLFIIWSASLAFIIKISIYALYNSQKSIFSNSIKYENIIKIAIMIFCTSFFIITNPSIKRSIWTITGKDKGELLYQRRRDWSKARKVINRYFKDHILITTHPMTAVYYIGDFDGVYNRNKKWELMQSQEYLRTGNIGATGIMGLIDDRHGRPVAGEEIQLREMAACQASFVFLTPPPEYSPVIMQLVKVLNEEGIQFSLIKRPEFVLVGWTGHGEQGNCGVVSRCVLPP